MKFSKIYIINSSRISKFQIPSRFYLNLHRIIGKVRDVWWGIGLSIARKHESQSPEGIPLKLVRYQAKRAKFERLLDNPVKSRESKARLWIFEVVEQATEFIRTNPQRVEDRSEVELLVYWEKVGCVPFGLRIVNLFQRIA